MKRKLETGFDDKAQKDLTGQFILSEKNEFTSNTTPEIVTPTKAKIGDLLIMDKTSELAKTKLLKSIDQVLQTIDTISINKEQKNQNYLSQTEDTLLFFEQRTNEIKKELEQKNSIYSNERAYFEETEQLILSYKKMVRTTIKIYETIKLLLPKINEIHIQFPTLEQWIKEETNSEQKQYLIEILGAKTEIKKIFEKLRIYGRDLRYNIFSLEEIEATIKEAHDCIRYFPDLT